MPLRGTRLRDMRLSRGWTQEELAERLGLGIRQIHRYESGENDPAGDIIARIAKELDVTTDYLLGLADDPLGQITEEDLSPMEHKLLSAVRNGLIYEALEAVTTLTKRKDQSHVIPNQPAVNG